MKRWIYLFIGYAPWFNRLFDGQNITMEDQHMWLIPFSYGSTHTLMVRFEKTQTVAGLRVWNYNKSPEDTYRGVRERSTRVQTCLALP